MANDNNPDAAAQIEQLVGALDIIDILREEMEEWLGEAQDESKRECLENVVGHIGGIAVEYRKRLKEMRDKASN